MEDFDGTLLEHSIKCHLDVSTDADLCVDWDEDASLGYVNLYERESSQNASYVVPKCSNQSAATPSNTLPYFMQLPSARAFASPQRNYSRRPTVGSEFNPCNEASVTSKTGDLQHAQTDTAADLQELKNMCAEILAAARLSCEQSAQDQDPGSPAKQSDESELEELSSPLKYSDPLWNASVRNVIDGIPHFGNVESIDVDKQTGERLYCIRYNDGDLQHLDEYQMQTCKRH